MTHTTFGTWRQVFGHYLDDGMGIDPYGELNLTDDQRHEMNRTAREMVLQYAEDLLNEAYPEAGFMIDRLNGDVLCLRDASIDTESVEWEDLAYWVQIGPDLDDLLDEYVVLSSANDAGE